MLTEALEVNITFLFKPKLSPTVIALVCSLKLLIISLKQQLHRIMQHLLQGLQR
jgi:hypothetical protein